MPYVRRHDGRQDRHVEDTTHIPIDGLTDRLGEAPGGTAWVPCASGCRAGIAAILLDRGGHDAVHVDDDCSNAEKAGLSATG